jgi:hypothetical protein
MLTYELFVGGNRKHDLCPASSSVSRLDDRYEVRHPPVCSIIETPPPIDFVGNRRQGETLPGISTVKGHFNGARIVHQQPFVPVPVTMLGGTGISDVMLGKVCRGLRIPKPGRGSWAKKAAGRPLEKRPPMPELNLATRSPHLNDGAGKRSTSRP